MPVSHENIRAETLIEETPENTGLIMTVTVTAYDTGLLQVGPASGTAAHGLSTRRTAGTAWPSC